MDIVARTNTKMLPPSTSVLLSLVVILASVPDVTSVRHIVFIVADDLGWNDVGFHNPDMITPNIDKLASEGVILNNSYVQPVCTPSRHAFMTGTYPFKHGLQRRVIFPAQPFGSPLNLKFLPENLRDLGYKTHMLGKWHLGSCNDSYTPTFRGFDSFLGLFNGAEDYYNKTLVGGIDFNDGVTPIDPITEYSTSLYAKKASDIIRGHDQNSPLFLYMSFQAVHNPIQVPKIYEDMYPNVTDKQRRQYCGMVTAMDDAIGNITDALEESGLMNDTLIVFISDNGGWPAWGGNNYPLRGGKVTIFEGGTRAVTFVHGAGLQKTGYTYDGLIHAVDWNPTIIAAAGGNTDASDHIDGINLWDSISNGTPSNRTEFIYNLDEKLKADNGHAAIRVGNYKLIDGYPGPYDGWYKPGEVNNRTDNYDGEHLYDLSNDPVERVDISKDNPEIVARLKARLEYYRQQLVPANDPPNDPRSLPNLHRGHWTTGWC